MATILSKNLVGSEGPNKSHRTRNITNVPIMEWIMVNRRMVANFVKKVIVVKSITIAAKKVVVAAASIEGPMWIKAYFVLSFRDR